MELNGQGEATRYLWKHGLRAEYSVKSAGHWWCAIPFTCRCKSVSHPCGGYGLIRRGWEELCQRKVMPSRGGAKAFEVCNPEISTGYTDKLLAERLKEYSVFGPYGYKYCADKGTDRPRPSIGGGMPIKFRIPASCHWIANY